MHIRRYIGAAILLSLALISSAQASPWIEADDPFLRVSVQQLADAGHLSSTVNTFPLMWSRIARDLRQINVAKLGERDLFAYYRIRAALEFAEQHRVTGVQLRAATESDTQQGFGTQHREEGAFRVSRSITGDYVAVRLQTTLKTRAIDGKKYSFEGSYLATTFGNWAVSLDQMDVWWGPAQDNALVLSSNSPPIQALRINRLSDELPAWMPDLGQFHFTAFLGRTQRSGSLGDHPIYGMRASWRPNTWFELGASYTGQWGGDGYSADLTHMADVLSLQNSPSVGNQRAGIDLRIPLSSGVGVYGELATNNSELTDTAHTLGIDYSFSQSAVLRQIYLEYSDIPAEFYADARDSSGYRRYQMSMGASIDQHAESIALGVRQQFADGSGWGARLGFSTLGESNGLIQRKYSLINPTETTRHQVDFYYQKPWGDALVKVQLDYHHDRFSRSDLDPSMGNSSSKSGVNISASWELRF